jgi:shikimate dehydrogenase
MSPGRIGLIGDPVSHSISPPMHEAAFRATGLDLSYVAVPVRREELGDAFPQLRTGFIGLNVTTPLKEDVIPLLDDLSPEAARAGSVNTIVFGERSMGHSTDGTGFQAALRRAGMTSVRRAVVLGTGGAARAVSARLLDAGADVVVWGRNRPAGARIAEQLPVSFVPADEGGERLASALSEADLLVNATPIGGRGGGSPVPHGAALHRGLTVFDLVYRPRRTSLLHLAVSHGCRIVEGVEMLIEQGALSFGLLTGQKPPVAVMREAAYRALERAPAISAAGPREGAA